MRKIEELALAETFEEVRRSIVALVSRAVVTRVGEVPVFPEIIGTGFFVDTRGVVATNRHVIEVLSRLRPHPETGRTSAAALVHLSTQSDESGKHLCVQSFVDVRKADAVTKFESGTTSWYGQQVPDIGFIQVEVQDVPALQAEDQPGCVRAGIQIATAGFPLGEQALLMEGRVAQVTPFLRQGIVSSVLPFPSPRPHGFTIDVMMQGGSSGSPVFEPNTGGILGMVWGGFEQTNFTFVVPGHLIAKALESYLKEIPLDVSRAPTLEALLKAERTSQLEYDSFLAKPG